MGPNLKDMMRKSDHRPNLNGLWELQGRGSRYRIKQQDDGIAMTAMNVSPPLEMFRANFTDNVTLVGRVTVPKAPGYANDTINVEAPDRITFANGGTMTRVGD